MVNVLVCDKDVNYSITLSRYLTKDKDVRVIANLQDCNEIKPFISEGHTDVLIASLDSFSSSSDLNLLECLVDDIKTPNLYVMLLWPQISKCAVPNIKKAKCRVWPKGFSTPVVADNILGSISRLKDRRNSNYCSKICSDLCFNPSAKGTKYLMQACSLAKDYPYLLNNLNTLYAELAKKINVKADNIGWTIDKAINSAFYYAPRGTFKQVFHDLDADEKPSTKKLIELIARRLGEM